MAFEAQPATFMLLPDETYAPNKDIQLGTLLLLSKETRLPNPDSVLNESTREAPPEQKIKRSKAEPWSVEDGRVVSGSGGLDAEIPVFTPVGGGLKYGRWTNHNLNITCDRLETERFYPDPQYLSRALKDDFIQEYCRKRLFPSVYMVTGLKVAHNTVFSNSNERGSHGEGHLNVDASSTGVPLKVGPTGEGKEERRKKKGMTIADPFILAYQLKRLRLKRDGSLKEMEGFNKYALFDDEGKAVDDTAPGVLEEFWEVEDVLPTTDHEK